MLNCFSLSSLADSISNWRKATAAKDGIAWCATSIPSNLVGRLHESEAGLDSHPVEWSSIAEPAGLSDYEPVGEHLECSVRPTGPSS